MKEPNVPRYFVAIPLPDEAMDRLVAVQPPAITGMRLLERDELHLTLHFLGEVAPHLTDAVRAGLARLRLNAFAITISGVGQFLSEGRPQVLWAGIDSSSSLLALHHAIGTTLTDAIGFQPEERPYSPHVTLARLNTPALPDAFDDYLKEKRDSCVTPVLVKQFALYSSVFTNNVRLYKEEAVFHLVEPALSD
jgi:2'-5' RNA ligase